MGYETGLLEINDGLRARVFGELVRIAGTVMEAYQSDLWHDAAWIRENVTGPESTFYWSVNASGTSIGVEPGVGWVRERRYRVTVRVVDGRMTADFAPDVLPAVCSQCGPGHAGPDGLCERHGKRIAR